MSDFYLVRKARLKSLLLQEIKLSEYEAVYDYETVYLLIGEETKTILVDEIKDFNSFVLQFRNQYKRDPLDDDELKEYIINECKLSEIKKAVVEQDIQDNYELLEK